jgi:hypothetical protein
MQAEQSDSDDAADYISTITAELAEMAALHGWPSLAGLLEMARLEAEQLCGRDSCDSRDVAREA